MPKPDTPDKNDTNGCFHSCPAMKAGSLDANAGCCVCHECNSPERTPCIHCHHSWYKGNPNVPKIKITAKRRFEL